MDARLPLTKRRRTSEVAPAGRKRRDGGRPPPRLRRGGYRADWHEAQAPWSRLPLGIERTPLNSGLVSSCR
jgi:hypothetical protein